MEPVDLTKVLKGFNQNKLPPCCLCGTEEIGLRNYDPTVEGWVCGNCKIKIMEKIREDSKEKRKELEEKRKKFVDSIKSEINNSIKS